MVCIIFLFLTRFYVNNARSSGNPTWCAFQSYSIMFSRQILMHVYYAFKSYVRQEGHLYEVFRILGDMSYLRTSVKGCSKIRRVLAKLRLILDKIFRLYRKFVSYLTPISHNMRLIFPRMIGLLSSYVPQILLQIHANLFCPQPVRIIARKYANRLVPHTTVRLNKFLLWNIRNQYKNYVQLFVVLIAYHRAHFFVVRCLRRCQVHVQAVVLWVAFRHANNIAVKSAILLIFRHSHLLSVHCNVQFTVMTCARRTVVLPHLNNRHF